MNKRTGIDTSGIQRQFDGCIYVAELTNGAIKVGCSANPKTRLSSLDRYTKLKYSARVKRFHISQNIPLRSAQHCEKRLIEMMHVSGVEVAGTIEFFHDVSFDSAVDMAMLITHGYSV